MKRHLYTITSIVGLTQLVGCAAMDTAISKRSLDVQTKQSATIFLDPVVQAQKTVYVQVKNTSDKSFEVENNIKEAIADKGYRVVNNLDDAHYLLQANILKVGKMDTTAAERMLHSGYGSATAGAAIGAIAGGLSGHRDGIWTGGIAGAAVATAANAMVKDVHYSVVTDVQISERITSGATVQENRTSNLNQGLSTTNVQKSSENVAWKRYQTRILSDASRVNLKFETALPKLKQGLTHAISGMF